VPRSQQLLFAKKYERGALGFIQECLRKVFTQIPAHDNYFYRLYLDGKYSRDCCPSYLLEENQTVLKARMEQVQTYTSTVSDFLKQNPAKYSHYILLDHQDWLAANNIPALEEEWKLILQNSRPGTRILMRSAAHEVDFFPKFVLDAVDFEQELTTKTHREDRVGTYASVYLAIVK
jgi:S-adenosylmethionine-diacylglycerol 3-amino-3-carboxypropyl transferase